ncbi:MAG: hypothetical protein GF353_01785 [Candidatus Lokiarchaeota archaeon]|nr:hypothetical protein [Candidatus Lokiarchaeota archaeon]
MCPEISLFDNNHGMVGVGEVACVSATYERGEEFELIEFRHFSECPEFCYWNYTNSIKKTSATKRSGLSKRIKFEIFQRDNFICQYCGKSKDDGATLHVDHKIPISKGGTDSFDNLITACSECNIGKSNKII